MNLPSERVLVLILNPNTNSWEFGYYFEGKWWQGVDNDPNDIIIDYIPLEWKHA